MGMLGAANGASRRHGVAVPVLFAVAACQGILGIEEGSLLVEEGTGGGGSASSGGRASSGGKTGSGGASAGGDASVETGGAGSGGDANGGSGSGGHDSIASSGGTGVTPTPDATPDGSGGRDGFDGGRDAAPDAPAPVRECTPNLTPKGCSATGNTPQFCNANGRWQNVASGACPPSTPSCSGGSCFCEFTTCGQRCVNTNADGNHCGDCNHTCFGGACSTGTCRPSPIATAQQGPLRITANASGIYWTAFTARKVMKAGFDGSNATPIAEDQPGPWGIAVDATNVYWTNQGGGLDPERDGGVMKATLPSGTPVELVRQAFWPRDIAVDGTDAYFVSYDNFGIAKVPLGGGTRTTVATTGGPYSLALDSSSVYWTNVDSFKIQKIAKSGGAVSTLASVDPSFVQGIAVFKNEVYWAAKGGGGAQGKISRSPTFGGAVTEIAVNQPAPDGIAVDATGVYWTNATTAGTIVRFNASGTTIIATGQGTPTSIVLTADSVYWTNNTTGEVMRLAK